MRLSRSFNTKDQRWYLGVPCAHCALPILFSLDRSEGHGPMSPCLKLVLTCAGPECGHQADYTGALVSRYRKGDDAAGVVLEPNRL